VIKADSFNAGAIWDVSGNVEMIKYEDMIRMNGFKEETFVINTWIEVRL
jgi:hypothetical protein